MAFIKISMTDKENKSLLARKKKLISSNFDASWQKIEAHGN
jgi:hypothetical protein